MQFFDKRTEIDFVGMRKLPMLVSALLVIGTMILLATRGLNLGLDFTGGTLVELSYKEAVEVSTIRGELEKGGHGDAIVQHFGTTRDILIRLPVKSDKDAVETSNQLVALLREQRGEAAASTRADQQDGAQMCRKGDAVQACDIQVRRVEFVGPQIGDELTEKGGLALIYTLIAILIYVAFRFQWRFSLGAILATAHDVLLTFGFFSLTQIEFDLTVLAAILAVLGYSLNDTIVVFDRIRENFHTLRKSDVVSIMNRSINDTLSRTIITSGTTVLALTALFIFGGEIIHAFSIALLVGIVVGTYSSIFVATPAVLALGITRDDLLPPKKEGEAVDDMP
ncbi:MAG: protein translocase subunit SecF [Gammaproteobacteria bacterium]|nr:protein translocase subunit SecF [Gammaproteobacteria bacterium]